MSVALAFAGHSALPHLTAELFIELDALAFLLVIAFAWLEIMLFEDDAFMVEDFTVVFADVFIDAVPVGTVPVTL